MPISSEGDDGSHHMWGEDKRVVIAHFHVSASARTAVIAIGLLRLNGFRWRDTEVAQAPALSADIGSTTRSIGCPACLTAA
ncbi:hypothetical protein PXNS11_150345 [Stutzerimonas xanthomarina]|nr:hypothetical protein PXNS11_150345 [Stutzerimonas xanthomarina]